MFISVRLLNGFSESLLYETPGDWHAIKPGTFVRVPLKNALLPAMVTHIYPTKPSSSFGIRQAHSLDPFPQDTGYLPFIKQLSIYYQVPELSLLKRIRQFIIENHQPEELTLPESSSHEHKKITLTGEQQTVVDFITPRIITPEYTPTLLHGVTGSGKTEVYKHLIQTAHEQQKSTLLLLPEVTLAIQFAKLLKQQLDPKITLVSFHSGTPKKDKQLLWQLLLSNAPVVIIGVHLPILLPICNLGLIIVDEEHETGYQEKKHPKINTKEACLLRAHALQIPIVLGSATPSISSLHAVKTKGWHFFELKKRFSGEFPKIEIVPLATKDTPFSKRKKNFWISYELELALSDRLAKKEQTIIFLNRRGHSFFVQCKSCTYVFECKNCSVSLTLHESNTITCHYCGYSRTLASSCPKCQAHEDQFLKKGIGTQQIVTILQKMFPQARIARADHDTTTKKKIWQQTVTDFGAGNLDILVGTQTITKGFHFPGVTLVGIIWADLNLHFPVYNAAESALQQLIQVAGRAGRDSRESTVIVQTFMEHPIFSYLNEIDYCAFYEREIAFRQEVGYPPCLRLAEIELRHTSEQIIEFEADKLLHFCMDLTTQRTFNITILGPAKPPVFKIKNIHSRKLYLKGEAINELIKLYQSIDKNTFRSSLFFTPNPL